MRRRVEFSQLAEYGLQSTMQRDGDRIASFRSSIAWYVRNGGPPSTELCKIDIDPPLYISLLANDLRVLWQDSDPILVWSVGRTDLAT
jgi:hypothetical protein